MACGGWNICCQSIVALTRIKGFNTLFSFFLFLFSVVPFYVVSISLILDRKSPKDDWYFCKHWFLSVYCCQRKLNLILPAEYIKTSIPSIKQFDSILSCRRSGPASDTKLNRSRTNPLKGYHCKMVGILNHWTTFHGLQRGCHESTYIYFLKSSSSLSLLNQFGILSFFSLQVRFGSF